MTRRFLIQCLGLTLLFVHAGAGQPPAPAVKTPARAYTPAPGPHEVATIVETWTDDVRDREMPVKIYYPASGDGPFPIIIFSHGLGGSRDGYAYLGRHWASHGYVSVHVQHVGSDTAVWQDQGRGRAMEAMRKAAADPRNAINRPLDVRFAIDRMKTLQDEPGPLQGRLGVQRIGAAGHSFGAYTTLAVAGEVFVSPRGKQATLADPRVKAAIPMSAPVPKNRDQLDAAFGPIRIPCLHMTGTLDNSPIGDTTAADRRLPYDHINNAPQYLVIFKDGDHMIFSGRPRLRGGGQKDAVFQDLIRASTTAFWDAWLKHDAAARSWLEEGGFKKALAGHGTFEMKKPPATKPAR